MRINGENIYNINNNCRLRISATNPGSVHMTTKQMISVSSAITDKEKGNNSCSQCECPNLIEVNLRIKACTCGQEYKVTDTKKVSDKICECLKSNSKSNFLKIDFVDGNSSDPEECPEKRRNVLVLKLTDLDVKCENGLRHELYFPAAAATAVKTLSAGDCLAYSMSSTGDIHEHKPIPVPTDVVKDVTTQGMANNRELKKCSKKPVQRQISKSMDDVKPLREKTVKTRSAQNVAEKGVGQVKSDNNSMSDMGSIELIIISDEFLNETQNQEVIIVDEEKVKTTRSKSFQIKKSFLHESKTTTNGANKDRGDYFKRAAEAKAKAAQLTASGGAGATGGKRLVIISDEYKRKSMESTAVKIVKSKEKAKPLKGSGIVPLMMLPKSKTISNAMVDLNSKIISCVLQSYEEPERLENKELEAKLLKEKLAKKNSCPEVPKSVTPEK